MGLRFSFQHHHKLYFFLYILLTYSNYPLVVYLTYVNSALAIYSNFDSFLFV
nr:MAG TPA: hypothetical protein [Caudoviricetes sp.]